MLTFATKSNIVARRLFEKRVHYTEEFGGQKKEQVIWAEIRGRASSPALLGPGNFQLTTLGGTPALAVSDSTKYLNVRQGFVL